MGDNSGSARAVRLLRQVAAALAAGGPLDGLPEVVARVAEWCPARRAALAALPDGSAAILYLVAASDEAGVLRVPFERAAYPAIDRALAERRPLCEPAAEPSSTGVELRGEGRLLLMPVVADGQVNGCLMVRLADAAAPDEDELEVLHTVCQLLALSLRGGLVLANLRDQTRKIAVDDAPWGRRQALQAAREAVAAHRDFFDASADGMVAVDAAGEVLHVNRAFEQLTGYARSGVCGLSLLSLVPPVQHAALGEVVARSLGGEQIDGFDFEIVTTSGEILKVSASTSAMLLDHHLAVLSFRDVTEARALEDELRVTKDFLLRLLDSAGDGVVAADMRGNVILFNQGASRVTGWRAEEVVGRLPVWKLYPDGVAHQVMAELRAPDHDGRLPAAEREVVSRYGEHVPVMLAASIVYQDGREVATVGIFSDLRERIGIERRLADAQEKLVASEKQALIAELAGATAHELNQPLTAIVGYTELLLKHLPNADPSRRALAIVLREADRMAEIVRKIGKITHYESKPYVGATSIVDFEKSAGQRGT